MGRPGAGAQPVGRRALVDEVTRSLADGGTVELVGDPGVGKTTVFRAVIAANTADVDITHACQSAETGFGLVVVSDVLADLERLASSDGAPGLPPLLNRALDVIVLRRAADELAVPLDGRLVGSTLAALLTQVAMRRSMLVAIDDLQWCDDESFAALRFAILRAKGGAVRWLTARRPDSPHTMPGSAQVTVPTLPAAATRDLIAVHLGRQLPPPTLWQVWKTSGGNPMYALEIARALPADAPSVDDVTLPGTLRELVASRVRSQPATARRAMLDLAVRGSVGSDFDRLPDLDPAHAARLVETTRGRTTFTHPLLTAGIIETSAPGAVRTARARAAAAVRDPVMRARHLGLATTAADDVVAAELDAAVHVAASRGDVSSAAWISARAVALSEADPPPFTRLAAAAQWAASIYNPAAVGYAQDMVRNARTPTQQAQAWLALADALSDDMPRALEAVREGLRVEGADADVRARLLTQEGALLLVRGQHRAAAEVLHSALTVVDPGTPTWADLVGELSMVQRIAGLSVDISLLRKAADLVHADLAPRPLNALLTWGLLAMWDDRHLEARESLREVTLDAVGTAEEEQAAFHLSELDVRTGHVDAALGSASEMASREDGQPLAAALWVTAMAAAWLGQEQTCRDAASRGQAVSHETGDGLFDMACKVAVGFLELTLGRPEAAWPLLAAACEALERQGFREPSCFPALPLAVEAAVAVGDGSEARRLLARLAEQGELLNSRWADASVLRCQGHLVA
ncbi:MAG TPA: AAA family ATPase, partial [Pedococcus sp.]|nr:AAA family ATPase [Pedococcus sp.]